MKLNSD